MSNPAARTLFRARSVSSALWTRPRNWSSLASKLCAPTADAVDAATAIVPEAAGIHHAGVRFQRDLHPLIEVEQSGGFVEYGADAGSLKGRRGAAAEEDGLDGPVRPRIRLGVVAQLPHQRLRVFFLGDPGRHVRVEVAVGALADAIRDVDVEGEGVPHARIPRQVHVLTGHVRVTA